MRYVNLKKQSSVSKSKKITLALSSTVFALMVLFVLPLSINNAESNNLKDEQNIPVSNQFDLKNVLPNPELFN